MQLNPIGSVITESSNLLGLFRQAMSRWSRSLGLLLNGLVVAALFFIGTVCHAATLNNYFNFINIGSALNSSGLVIAAGNNGSTTTASQDGNMTGDQAFFAGYAGKPICIRLIVGNNTKFGVTMTTPGGTRGAVTTLYDYAITYSASSHTVSAYMNGTQVGASLSDIT
jgi:hypothetical protein